MIFEQIVKIAPPGTVIPKPQAKGNFYVKGIGMRRGETALIYTIPNHKNPNSRYQKGVTISEFEKAYRELKASGKFTREWFVMCLSECNKEGGCNFTTIGGLFVLLGEAVYTHLGTYKYVVH